MLSSDRDSLSCSIVNTKMIRKSVTASAHALPTLLKLNPTRMIAVAITSMAQSQAAGLGVQQDKKLYEVCDVVIDNCGSAGDAILPIPGTELHTAATSSLVGIAIMNHIVYGVACAFAKAGKEPPVFMTANLPGGDEWNQRMIERYGERVNLA